MTTSENEMQKVNSILKVFKEMHPLTRWISIIAIPIPTRELILITNKNFIRQTLLATVVKEILPCFHMTRG